MKSLMLLGLILVASNVYAARPLLKWCYNCTDSQMPTQAKASRNGIVYVGDPIKHVVNGYEVYIEVEDTNPPTRTKVADRFVPQQADLDSIDFLISYYDAQPKGWHKQHLLRVNGSLDGSSPSVRYSYPDPDVSVYDVINPGRGQNELADWVSNRIIVVGENGAVAAFQAASIVQLADASSIPKDDYLVIMKDGSQIIVKTDYSKSPTKYSVDQTTGRDSHGNDIPYVDRDGSVRGLGGTYEFNGPGNPNDHQNFLNQLALFGVPIRSGGSNDSGGGYHGWACIKYTDPRTKKVAYTCQKM